MASTIKIKNGTSGAPSSLAQGELAININNGSLFFGTENSSLISSSFTFSHVTASGIIKAEHFLSTDDAEITDDLTVGGNIDLEGDIDVNGTLEADTITVDGVALATFVRDTVGTNMVSSNTETGITVTYDTTNDNLDFAVDAAQTGITSLLATDIKIGEDDQTKIDFETADEIHFYANNIEQVYLADNIFGPQSDSDVDLGTTGVRWKDAYIDTITTTGDINANGNIVGDDSTNITNIAAINLDTIKDDASGGDTNIALTGTTLNIEVGGETFLESQGDRLKFHTNITASGNISASSANSILTIPRRHLDQTVQGSVTNSTGSLAQGDIYYSQSDIATVPGKIYSLLGNGNQALVDIDNEAYATKLIGVAIGTQSGTDGYLLRGMVKLHTNPFPGEGALGNPVYLKDGGLGTGSIAGYGSDDYIRIIGYGISGSGTIYFNPDNTFIKKA